jgi:hypothetical protein
MQLKVGVTLIIMWAASLALADGAGTQTSIGETLSSPDSHETGQGPYGRLLGDCRPSPAPLPYAWPLRII